MYLLWMLCLSKVVLNEFALWLGRYAAVFFPYASSSIRARRQYLTMRAKQLQRWQQALTLTLTIK